MCLRDVPRIGGPGLSLIKLWWQQSRSIPRLFLAYPTFFLNHPSIISLLLACVAGIERGRGYAISFSVASIAWLRQDRHLYRTRSNGHPGDASAIFGKIILRSVNFLAHHFRCGRSSKKASFKLSYFDLISGECLLTEFLIDQVSPCIQTWEASQLITFSVSMQGFTRWMKPKFITFNNRVACYILAHW